MLVVMICINIHAYMAGIKTPLRGIVVGIASQDSSGVGMNHARYGAASTPDGPLGDLSRRRSRQEPGMTCLDGGEYPWKRARLPNPTLLAADRMQRKQARELSTRVAPTSQPSKLFQARRMG